MSEGIGCALQPNKTMRRNRIDYLVDDSERSGGLGTTSPARVDPVGRVARVAPAQPYARSGVDSLFAGSAVSQQPDCRRCQHFAVSWDPAVPYLCRGFGFKSRSLPSWEVLQADGHPCRLFAARQ